MNAHERFKDKFLLRLGRIGEDGWLVRTSLLAFDYGIPEASVRKLLLEWAQEGLIWLGADDGAALRPWNEWGNTNEMFSADVDSGQIRVKLLPSGAAHCEDDRKRLTVPAS